MFDYHCGATKLQYLGRFKKYQTPQRPMYYDPDLAKLCDKEKINYAPADMSQTAFYKGLAKFGKTTKPNFNREAFSCASKMMRKHFSCLRGSVKSTIPDILQDMKMDTSPGPALKTLYRTKGEAVSDERFWEMYRKYEAGMHLHGGVRTYWGACSKQELREEEKVYLGKTRVFMSGSLFLYLFASLYCKNFNDRFYASVYKTCSCVGMSKFSGGFHCVYERLRYKLNCGSTDASGWDTCMNDPIMEEIYQFRLDCLSGLDEEETIEAFIAMDNILDNVLRSFIMTPEGEICRKEIGNPSGHSNTIVDNTLGHYLDKAYSWVVSVYEKPDINDWEKYYKQFSDNVDMNLFGDDDMFSVSDEFKDLYNPETIIEASAELGFTFTTEEPELAPAETLSFLSHAVAREKNGFLVPYLPLNRLCSAAVYSNNGDVLIRAQRLSNLRYEGYYTPGWLPLIDSMIDLFCKKHPDEDVLEVFRCQLSNHEIEYLYLPLESGSDKSIPRILNMNKLTQDDKPSETSPSATLWRPEKEQAKEKEASSKKSAQTGHRTESSFSRKTTRSPTLRWNKPHRSANFCL